MESEARWHRSCFDCLSERAIESLRRRIFALKVQGERIRIELHDFSTLIKNPSFDDLLCSVERLRFIRPRLCRLDKRRIFFGRDFANLICPHPVIRAWNVEASLSLSGAVQPIPNILNFVLFDKCALL